MPSSVENLELPVGKLQLSARYFLTLHDALARLAESVRVMIISLYKVYGHFGKEISQNEGNRL